MAGSLWTGRGKSKNTRFGAALAPFSSHFTTSLVSNALSSMRQTLMT
jgi:hypothetical protein